MTSQKNLSPDFIEERKMLVLQWILHFFTSCRMHVLFRILSLNVGGMIVSLLCEGTTFGRQGSFVAYIKRNSHLNCNCRQRHLVFSFYLGYTVVDCPTQNI